MSLIALIALFGWIPVVLFLFTILPPRRAVLVAYVAGWLILPPIQLSVPGLPNYTKVTAVAYAVLLGCLLFDFDRLSAFRPRWFDLPILVWCLCPFASSVSNGLGAYDGASAVLSQVIMWGIPYFIGRLYFCEVADLRELAMAIFIGGLAYVPFCLFELRMSGQLCGLVYGVHNWTGSKYGLYNPVVFLANALEVGMWMTAAALMGFWLWMTGNLPRLWNVSPGKLVAVQMVMAVLCHQTGALLLLMAGLALLWGARRTGSSLLIWILVLAPPAYIAVRAGNFWSGRELVDIARTLLNEGRAGSLEFRLKNEDILADKAIQRPVFGWGGWGRNRVYNDKGRDISITDGLWIMILGINGFVGLGSEMTVMLLPIVLLLLRCRSRGWSRDDLGPAVVLAILVTLYQIDCIMNAMFNPIYVLTAGALVGLRIPTGPHPRTDRIAVAELAYRSAVLEYVQSVAGIERQRCAAVLEAAGRGLARALQEAEESAVDTASVAEAASLLLSLIQVDVGLAGVLRAVGLEAEAGTHYLRAVGRGERLLACATGRGAAPGTTNETDDPSGFCWDPTRPETVASCWARAIGLWERIEQIAPGCPEVRAYRADACNNLAWLLALDPTMPTHDLGRACELAATAVVMAPNNAGHWNTLALAHARTRDWDATIAALDHARRLGNRPSPFDLYILAIARAHLGDHEGARAAVDRADSLLPRDRGPGADLQILRTAATVSLEAPRKALIDLS